MKACSFGVPCSLVAPRGPTCSTVGGLHLSVLKGRRDHERQNRRHGGHAASPSAAAAYRGSLIRKLRPSAAIALEHW